MSPQPIIETHAVHAGYGAMTVVRDLELAVEPGEVVALFGPNGAGKTTSLMAICGEVAVKSGEVLFDGKPTRTPLHLRARAGLGLVTEQRAIFTTLSVRDNLRVSRCDEEAALRLFPELAEHLSRRAGLLSGGQQQMLALARALTRGKPRLLLIDEISLGLGPQIVDRLLETIRSVADQGVGVLLVEQFVHKALQIADHVHVMRHGRVVLNGPATEFRGNVERIQHAYLANEPGDGPEPTASADSSAA